MVGPTAGRWYIDVSSGVTPKQFIRGEWFVTIAALTGLMWILVYWASGNTWSPPASPSRGYTLRVLGLWYAWEEPLAKEPKGVYKHSDGGRCSAASSRASHNESSATSVCVVEGGDTPGS